MSRLTPQQGRTLIDVDRVDARQRGFKPRGVVVAVETDDATTGAAGASGGSGDRAYNCVADAFSGGFPPKAEAGQDDSDLPGRPGGLDLGPWQHQAVGPRPGADLQKPVQRHILLAPQFLNPMQPLDHGRNQTMRSTPIAPAAAAAVARAEA